MMAALWIGSVATTLRPTRGVAAFLRAGEERFLLDHDKRLSRKEAMPANDVPDYGQVDCNYNESYEQTDR
jgi:hypothetical protein